MKIALITGASRGIGAATAREFAKRNYTVIINYNKSEREAERLKRELLAEGYDAHLFKADVSNTEEVELMFAWLEKYFKHLDVLVNNAGVALSAVCQDVTESQYDRVMSVNCKGAFLCCQKAIPLFLKGGGGAIVNVSSIWGIEGSSCESVYSMSKHALVGLTKSLSAELSNANVTVNCVCPPIVLTDMCAALSPSDVEEFCRANNVSVRSPDSVALDIVNLALEKESGIILQER